MWNEFYINRMIDIFRIVIFNLRHFSFMDDWILNVITQRQIKFLNDKINEWTTGGKFQVQVYPIKFGIQVPIAKL